MEKNNVTARAHHLSDVTRDFRLVQLTDCHILREADGELKGTNTRQSFDRVLSAVESDSTSWDLLLATGDLSQDESAESYAFLAQQLNRLEVPIAWIPGNHDDHSTMQAAFQASNILTARQVLLGNWQIVLLDSTIPGEVSGRVSEAQIEFMQSALRAHSQLHALVCLHHPAIDCGSAWLDKKSLRDADQFRDAVNRFDNVRGVLWGHVHQEAHFHRNGIEWMSTPSTSIQFKPDSIEFELDTLPPGYRSLVLKADGKIESEVIRVD